MLTSVKNGHAQSLGRTAGRRPGVVVARPRPVVVRASSASTLSTTGSTPYLRGIEEFQQNVDGSEDLVCVGWVSTLR